MATNNNLHKARSGKNDEFYTRLSDIEEELGHYKQHFKDKTVLCNCDNAYESNFVKYFLLNFNRLGLKKLIATCYAGGSTCDAAIPSTSSSDDITNDDRQDIPEKIPYKLVIDAVPDKNGDGRSELTDVESLLQRGIGITRLHGDGDFRSEECVDLLKEADIVVTNPPFSLFREYVAQLIEYNKDFLIIGNLNALTYKEIFPLIRDNKVWFGPSIHSGDRAFFVPDDYPLKAAGCGIDESTGRRFIRVKGVRWFTTLDTSERHKPLDLCKEYDPDDYPKYDNYDAIEVSKTKDIPLDYDGVMGVPITFLDKYCPDQFEILGCTANPEANCVPKRPRSEKAVSLIQAGRLKGAKCVGGNSNIYIDEDDYVHVIYHRILIRKKR